MAFPSVTYTFTNGSTADATQVNQNFTDLINGASDGTKSLNISALTVGSTATFNNNLVFGLSSSNTMTLNAAVASTIVVNANTTYDVGGSTLGFKSLYIGGSSTFTTRILGATLGSSWTLTLPTGTGTARQRLETDGTGVSSWQSVRRTPADIQNLAIAASISSNILTVSLVTLLNATAPSSTDPIDIAFRNSTLATGQPVVRSVTAATTLTVGTAVSLGLPTATSNTFFVYALDNSGSIELFASAHPYWDEGSLQTTSTTGTSNQLLFGANARSSMPVRLLGRIKATWTSGVGWSSITDIATIPFEKVAITCKAHVSSAGSYGSSSTRAQITAWATDTDTLNSFAGNQYTIPAAGQYVVMASLTWASGNENRAAIVEIRLNGSTVISSAVLDIVTTGGFAFNGPGMSAYYVGNFVAGDTIQMWGAQQNSGASAHGVDTATTYLVINRVGK